MSERTATLSPAAARRATIRAIPALGVALIWALLAVFMLGCAVWYSVLKPLRQRLLSDQNS